MEEGLLVARKNKSNAEFIENQDIHSFLAVDFEKLNSLTAQLNTAKLSDFVDESGIEADYFEEIHQSAEMPEGWVEEHQKWFAPDEAIISIRAVIAYLEQGCTSTIDKLCCEETVIDLKDCLRLLQIIHDEGDLFHFYPMLDI